MTLPILAQIAPGLIALGLSVVGYSTARYLRWQAYRVPAVKFQAPGIADAARASDQPSEAAKVPVNVASVAEQNETLEASFAGNLFPQAAIRTSWQPVGAGKMAYGLTKDRMFVFDFSSAFPEIIDDSPPVTKLVSRRKAVLLAAGDRVQPAKKEPYRRKRGVTRTKRSGGIDAPAKG